MSPRIPHAISVRSKQLPGYRAIARDISSGGIRIEMTGMVPEGEKLDITLDLDLINATVTTTSQVIWIREVARKAKYEAGLRFISLTTEAQTYLSNYINIVKVSLDKFL